MKMEKKREGEISRQTGDVERERKRKRGSVGEREVCVREREREPPKKRGMVGERNIGRETGGGRERERERERGSHKEGELETGVRER